MADRLAATYGPRGGGLKNVVRASVKKKLDPVASKPAAAPPVQADAFDYIAPSGRASGAGGSMIMPLGKRLSFRNKKNKNQSGVYVLLYIG